MKTIILLTFSNIFMTFAWYGHLRFRHAPLWLAILGSWLIAFVEYCFQVPANRIGYGRFNGAQLLVSAEGTSAKRNRLTSQGKKFLESDSKP